MSKGTKVSTGDPFGIIGWWVNRSLNDPNNRIYVRNITDKVTGSSPSAYIYFGPTMPTKFDMKKLIQEFETMESR